MAGSGRRIRWAKFRAFDSAQAEQYSWSPHCCEGPEGSMSIEWLGLSHAKLSGHAGVGGGRKGGPSLPGENLGQGSSGQSQGVQAPGALPLGLGRKWKRGCLRMRRGL